MTADDAQTKRKLADAPMVAGVARLAHRPRSLVGSGAARCDGGDVGCRAGWATVPRTTVLPRKGGRPDRTSRPSGWTASPVPGGAENVRWRLRAGLPSVWPALDCPVVSAISRADELSSWSDPRALSALPPHRVSTSGQIGSCVHIPGTLLAKPSVAPPTEGAMLGGPCDPISR